MTTAGFLHGPPHTTVGALISVVLMVAGFLLLSLLSAGLASLFVREDTVPAERREAGRDEEILHRLEEIARRLDALERDPGRGPDRP